MDPDEVAYRRSVRNMIAVLAAIVIVVFAALFIPYYLLPSHTSYQATVTLDSPYGFSMHLGVNATSVSQTGTVVIAGWVNSTSSSIENVTAATQWPVPQGKLWGRPCAPWWPIAIGVMQGHYTKDNYTFGTLIQIRQPALLCQERSPSPTSFAFEPHSSKVLVVRGGNPSFWVLQTELRFGQSSTSYQLQPGVYTALLADEWGDILTTNFLEP
jgi:hypothetical protein